MMNGAPTNELELDLQIRRITLRDFTFSLKPLRAVMFDDTQEEAFYRGERPPVTGVELEAIAKDTGIVVSLRFDRGEFVNLATAALAGLDAADEETGGGENN